MEPKWSSENLKCSAGTHNGIPEFQCKSELWCTGAVIVAMSIMKCQNLPFWLQFGHSCNLLPTKIYIHQLVASQVYCTAKTFNSTYVFSTKKRTPPLHTHLPSYPVPMPRFQTLTKLVATQVPCATHSSSNTLVFSTKNAPCDYIPISQTALSPCLYSEPFKLGATQM